jgi:hypothetical protein
LLILDGQVTHTHTTHHPSYLNFAPGLPDFFGA